MILWETWHLMKNMWFLREWSKKIWRRKRRRKVEKAKIIRVKLVKTNLTDNPDLILKTVIIVLMEIIQTRKITKIMETKTKIHKIV